MPPLLLPMEISTLFIMVALCDFASNNVSHEAVNEGLHKQAHGRFSEIASDNVSHEAVNEGLHKQAHGRFSEIASAKLQNFLETTKLIYIFNNAFP